MDDLGGQLTLVVCEHIRREVLAVLHGEGWETIRVVAFRPPRSVGDLVLPDVGGPTLREMEHLEILAGRCWSVDRARLGHPARTRLHLVDHCAEFFLPPSLARRYWETGTLLLFPGEVYERAAGEVAGQCPVSCPGAPKRLVLLDTGIDPSAGPTLEAVARMTDLPVEILPVGLDVLRLHLVQIVQGFRSEEEQRRLTAALSEAIRRSSDHALALDLIGGLAAATSEEQAIERVLDLFTFLFTPGRLVYLSWLQGHPGAAYGRPAPPSEDEMRAIAQESGGEDYTWLASGKSFRLRVRHQEETLGILELHDMALPAYSEHYLRLGLILSRVCGLAIAQARALERERHAQERIRHQAYHDPLTGLPNRLFFHEQLQDMLERSRGNERRLALLFIDIDRFKSVNDTLGHEMGDMLLKEIADRLRQSVRNGDIVARLGGDEFLVLVSDVVSREGAETVARRILASLREPFVLGDREFHTSASIGIALFPEHGDEAESLILQADNAMYEAKRSGRDGYRVASSGGFSSREGAEGSNGVA